MLTDEKISHFKDLLKRCPEGTLEALLLFLEKNDLSALDVFIVGVLKHHIEPEYEELLDGDRDALSFIDDLGIDSMSMIEIVMVVEECLGINLDNQDLVKIQTYSDLETYIRVKLNLLA
jgi:3-hydroxyacyl-[acyl-carrier-protein] dehydratase